MAASRLVVYRELITSADDVAAPTTSLRKESMSPSLVDNSQVIVPPVGKCYRGGRRNFRVNAAQLQFVVTLGEDNKAFKKSPEQAEEMFKLVGTVKGAEMWPDHPCMVSNVNGFLTFQ
jgi:hypothetical protein